jgi:hypothetical protein
VKHWLRGILKILSRKQTRKWMRMRTILIRAVTKRNIKEVMGLRKQINRYRMLK